MFIKTILRLKNTFASIWSIDKTSRGLSPNLCLYFYLYVFVFVLCVFFCICQTKPKYPQMRDCNVCGDMIFMKHLEGSQLIRVNPTCLLPKRHLTHHSLQMRQEMKTLPISSIFIKPKVQSEPANDGKTGLMWPSCAMIVGCQLPSLSKKLSLFFPTIFNIFLLLI